ncbi:vWA domain-containing protein [Runella salmonicolor]|uniref:VWA domain-containing protein n=1 Tax=Runella salmonicolor TaxID=2950278 RepID=A0ABT1FSK9_9BACT|nr:VWA domain-containing protein [Runella salmonicolor]MCP1384485.1 VWA domain-containing protein [Runella salmonicolor]
MRNNLIARQTSLSGHIVAFSRFLRASGISVGPDREADALKALAEINVGDEVQFYLALRSIYPQNRKQLREFDELYVKYWKELAKAVDSKIKEDAEESKSKKKKNNQNGEASFEALKNWLSGNRQPEQEELASYSLGEPLSQKDFGSYTDEDLYEARKIIRTLVQRMAKTMSRRYEAARSGGQLDLRRVLRNNFRKGDEIIDLFYRRPARNKIRLVLLCDVSKSMELYSRFWVQFMFAFQNLYQSIETFVFSTRLCRITEDLKEMEYTKALENLTERVPHWSGGTDIGAVLREFVQEYAMRKLNSRTIVLIISDGMDTGVGDDLALNMERIRRKARRVIWLNPLAGSPDYRPEVKALKAVLPHLDLHAPAHNLESLKRVVEQLR